jgi:nicotinic acetylcholine receptor, invertebrate
MILPCMILTFVSLFGFLVPSQSGEKANVNINILLSIIVFLMILMDYMPPNSDRISLLVSKLNFWVLTTYFLLF